MSDRSPTPVRLRALLPEAAVPGGDLAFRQVCADSRRCEPGDLFASLSPDADVAARYAAEAMRRGAVAVLTAVPLPSLAIPQVVVANARAAYARLCFGVAGDPQQGRQIAGVTGTNGKTTVCWMIRELLATVGRPCGLLGTIEYSDGVESAPATLTTPDAPTQAHWFAKMAARGVAHAAMEVSSHALDQDRAAGCRFDVSLVTNITQDHFDYHGDYAHYWNSKAKLLPLTKASGIIGLNLDDAGTARLRERVAPHQNAVTFGLDPNADVSAQIVEESRAGTIFKLRIDRRTTLCRSRLIGRHNVANALAAAVAGWHWGLSPEQIVEGLERFRPAPGRLEKIACGQLFDVYVDYAHTDDALRRAIAALRPVTAGRIICVFGAGGDRDRTKRPLLGAAACTADLAVVTSDNPRSEDPAAIIREIQAGMPPRSLKSHAEPDREAAIAWAFREAGPNDCVLIAGKGHEVEQIIGSERLPFDDRQVARKLLFDRTFAHPEALRPSA